MAATHVIVVAFLTVTGLVSAQMPFYAGPNYGIGGIGGIGFGYPGGLGAYAHGFEPVTGGIFPYYGAAHSLPWSAPVGGTTHTISHVAHGTLPHPVGPHVSTTSKTVSVHHPTTHVTVHHPAVTTHVQHPDIGFPAALTYPYPGLSPFFPQYPTGVLEHHSPVITETTVEKNLAKKNTDQTNTIYTHHSPTHTIVTKSHHVPSGYPFNQPGVVSTSHHQTVSHVNPGVGVTHLPGTFPGTFPATYPGLDYPYHPGSSAFGIQFPYLNAGLQGGAVSSSSVHTVHHPGVGFPPLYPGTFGGYHIGTYPFGFSSVTSSSTTTTEKDTKSSSGKSDSSSKN
uniref:Suckerin-7 n=1 Tax=Sepioteuthis lessoniana TaxID=34570 RepID=A0A081DU91_SEPLE